MNTSNTNVTCNETISQSSTPNYLDRQKRANIEKNTKIEISSRNTSYQNFIKQTNSFLSHQLIQVLYLTIQFKLK